MDDKYRIIALFGKSAAGKDTLLKFMSNAFPDELNTLVSCTTRLPRMSEVQGRDYNFMTKDEFKQHIVNNEMLEYTYFADNFYGTARSSLSKDKINIGVFNIDGIEQLLTHPHELIVAPAQVFARDKTRLLRSLQREEAPDCEEICRRYFADNVDFDKIHFKYITFLNDTDKKVRQDVLEEFFEDLKKMMQMAKVDQCLSDIFQI